MTDRIPSDHDAVETHRATLSAVGRTDRVQVVLPDAVAVDEGTVVDCALDGEDGYARVESTLQGDRVIRHVATNRRQAREGDGKNRLLAWADEAPVDAGGSVHLDVLTEGHAYGVRTPGTRVVYRVTDPPEDSLADIARDLGGE